MAGGGCKKVWLHRSPSRVQESAFEESGRVSKSVLWSLSMFMHVQGLPLMFCTRWMLWPTVALVYQTKYFPQPFGLFALNRTSS